MLLAAASHGTDVTPVLTGIGIIVVVVGALILFGWRPVRSRKVSKSPAATTARTTRRGARRVAARARSAAKVPPVQPDDAA